MILAAAHVIAEMRCTCLSLLLLLIVIFFCNNFLYMRTYSCHLRCVKRKLASQGVGSTRWASHLAAAWQADLSLCRVATPPCLPPLKQ